MPKFAHSPIHLPSPVYGGGVTVGDGGGSGLHLAVKVKRYFPLSHRERVPEGRVRGCDVSRKRQSQVLAFSNVCQIWSTVAFHTPPLNPLTPPQGGVQTVQYHSRVNAFN